MEVCEKKRGFSHSTAQKIFTCIDNACLESPKKDGKWQEDFPNRYVYLIKNNHTGLFKIGKSLDIFTRISQLQTQTGCDLVFICACRIQTFDTDEAVVESELHKYFSKKRVIGEWFRFTPLDIYRIKHVFWSIYVDDTIEPVSFYVTKKRVYQG